MIRPMIRPMVRPLTSAVTEGVGGGFSPLSLFAAGEQGAWYDPSDLSTLFQDAARTTPAALNQPVGLMLDKRRGLVRGAELCPTPLASTTPAGVSVVGEVLRFTAVAQNSSADITPIAPIFNASMYEVTFTISNYVQGAVRLIVYGTGTNGVAVSSGASANGTYRAVVPLSAGGSADQLLRVQSYQATAATLDVSSISVRELPGNHASQATAAARPVLMAGTGGRPYIDFDTVDDALVTTFASALGSSCTVARAIPGVGAQILTGQTIGTTFSNATDSHGLLIIDRALTAPETAAVTRWCAGRAGL